jgi:hypothetical protein
MKYIPLYIIAAILIGFGGYIATSERSEPPTATTTVQAVATTTSHTPTDTQWRTYTNERIGIRFEYPPTWKVETFGSGNDIVAFPGDLKQPTSTRPSFVFGTTAHSHAVGYEGTIKPTTRTFGTRIGYVYTKDQTVDFPDAPLYGNNVGGYIIIMRTPNGEKEPGQILETFAFTKQFATNTTSNTEEAKKRDATRVNHVKQLQLALELYYDEYSTYPADTISILAPRYISTIPLDPLDNKPYQYTYLFTSGGWGGYVLKIYFEQPTPPIGGIACGTSNGRYCFQFAN